MDPREFHSLAERLVGDEEPAECRTAISRAYYATYNVAIEILSELGFRIQDGPGGHGNVQNMLGNSGDNAMKRVGTQLGDLRSMRNKADYKLENPKPENHKTACAQVVQAGKMIRILDACKSNSKRSDIIASIREWKAKITGQGQ